MASQQVELQRLERVGCDPHVGERAKAGVDTVGRLITAGAALDDVARRLDPFPRRGGQGDRLAAVSDGQQLFERERGTV